MSIPSHVIEQLNSSADLVGIIGKHTTLKKRAENTKAVARFAKKPRRFMSTHKKCL